MTIKKVRCANVQFASAPDRGNDEGAIRLLGGMKRHLGKAERERTRKDAWNVRGRERGRELLRGDARAHSSERALIRGILI